MHMQAFIHMEELFSVLMLSYSALLRPHHVLQELDEYESAMVQVYRKLVDVYNGEGWLSQDGTLLTTSIAETTPFADSGYCSPELATVYVLA
jgi:hypothetical protein